MAEPIDTSTLGPIRMDPQADALKARIVREALESIGMDPALTFEEHKACMRMASVATVPTLIRLGRLLK